MKISNTAGPVRSDGHYMIPAGVWEMWEAILYTGYPKMRLAAGRASIDAVRGRGWRSSATTYRAHRILRALPSYPCFPMLNVRLWGLNCPAASSESGASVGAAHPTGVSSAGAHSGLLVSHTQSWLKPSRGQLTANGDVGHGLSEDAVRRWVVDKS